MTVMIQSASLGELKFDSVENADTLPKKLVCNCSYLSDVLFDLFLQNKGVLNTVLIKQMLGGGWGEGPSKA